MADRHFGRRSVRDKMFWGRLTIDDATRLTPALRDALLVEIQDILTSLRHEMLTWLEHQPDTVNPEGDPDGPAPS